MRAIEDIADINAVTDIHRRQAWSFVIGHPRSIRQWGDGVDVTTFLDDESARGDIVYDSKRIWLKIHDIETSVEPPSVFYRVVSRTMDNRGTPAVLANNVWVREFDHQNNGSEV